MLLVNCSMDQERTRASATKVNLGFFALGGISLDATYTCIAAAYTLGGVRSRPQTVEGLGTRQRRALH